MGRWLTALGLAYFLLLGAVACGSSRMTAEEMVNTFVQKRADRLDLTRHPVKKCPQLTETQEIGGPFTYHPPGSGGPLFLCDGTRYYVLIGKRAFSVTPR